jgi:hypothetical protein
MENTSNVSVLREALSKQRGQTMVFFVLGLSLVFLAVLGFAVDFGNMWFHRQRAQTAADAACTAAAMDMLYNVSATPTTPVGGFTVGTAFDCKGAPTSGPCQYASLNGYNGTGLTANIESNNVAFTFSSSFNGINPITYPLSPGTVYAPSSNGFVQTTVTDRIRTSFFGLVSPKRTIDVPAKAVCGVLLTTSPIPILVLDPTRKDTFQFDGGSNTSVFGGPPDSIQINSNNVESVNKNGTSGLIDLHQGGPGDTGSNMHVAINQDVKSTITSGQNCSGVDLCYGTTGNYGTHLPIPDPLAYIVAPDQPNWTGSAPASNGNKVTVATGVHGCPAPTGKTCTEFYPGFYNGGISVQNDYAIFVPGIYYINGGMSFGSNSCVRPSTQTGDGSGGTFFYFADNKSISVASNSGCNTNPQTTATNFQTQSGTGTYPLGVFCDSTALAAKPSNLPTSVSGSVLLAPCTAPNAALSMCAPNCTKNGGTGYGDPQGVHTGQQRGILLMQNRNQALSKTNLPSWQGGGTFLVSGTMYFHQCSTTSGADAGGFNCSQSAYTDQLEIGGNSTGTSYVLGDVIVDQLLLHGSSGLALDLSPTAEFVVYKASLLQ